MAKVQQLGMAAWEGGGIWKQLVYLELKRNDRGSFRKEEAKDDLAYFLFHMVLKVSNELILIKGLDQSHNFILFPLPYLILGT